MMRRWLIAFALALGAGALWAGAAFADASTYHSNYTNTTRACAGCHRAHTGSGTMLIKSDTIYGLCTSCHGSNSGLDVVDGVEWQTDPTTHAKLPDLPPVGGTKGGGFVNSYMKTALTTTGPNGVLAPSTSAHKVEGMTGYTGDTVWGIGAIGSGPGSTFTLQCTTCHDPHGKSGADADGNAIPTYRLLRSNVAAKLPAASGVVTVPEDSATEHDYLVDSTTQVYYGQTYTTDLRKLSDWCATCHNRIHTDDASSDPATSASGDAIYKFRHATTGTSVENNFGTPTKWPSGSPACLTCHTAHGSSAAMTRQAAQVPQPGTAEGGGTYLDSSLLRVDNRGVCELCHNK